MDDKIKEIDLMSDHKFRNSLQETILQDINSKKKIIGSAFNNLCKMEAIMNIDFYDENKEINKPVLINKIQSMAAAGALCLLIDDLGDNVNINLNDTALMVKKFNEYLKRLNKEYNGFVEWADQKNAPIH